MVEVEGKKCKRGLLRIAVVVYNNRIIALVRDICNIVSNTM